MKNHKRFSLSSQPGFSLIEMAIVLLIVALVAGGGLSLFSAQIEHQKYKDTEKLLHEAKDALIGFAILNGRLPCPSTTTDPANADYGLEDAACTVNTNGVLPWKTLGIAEVDAWGVPRKTAAASWGGYLHYRADPAFVIAFNLATTTTASLNLRVQNSSGTALTSTSQRPLAIIFSTGKNLTADGNNAIFRSTNAIYESDVTSQNFDDMTIWLSAPILFHRMIQAGRLS